MKKLYSYLLMLGLTLSFGCLIPRFALAMQYPQWEAYLRLAPFGAERNAEDPIAKRAIPILRYLQTGQLGQARELAATLPNAPTGCGQPDRYALLSNLKARIAYLDNRLPTARRLLEEARTSLELICGGDHPAVSSANRYLFDELAIQLGLPEISSSARHGTNDEMSLALHQYAELDAGSVSALDRFLADNDAFSRLAVSALLKAAEQSFYLGNFDQGLKQTLRAQGIVGSASGQDAYLQNQLDSLEGLFHRKLQNLQASGVAYRKAYTRSARLYAPDHPDLATISNNLAVLEMDLGHYDIALSLFQRSLNIETKRSPPEPREVATTQHNIAQLYLEMGDPEAALRASQNALKIHQDQLGGKDPRLPIIQFGIGLVNHDLNKFTDAIHHYQAAIAAISDLPPEHERQGIYRHSLALTLLEESQPKTAQRLLKQALGIYESAYPSRAHRHIVSALEALARTEAPAERENLLMDAVSLATKIDAVEPRWRAFSSWAQHEAAQGQIATGVFYAKLAINMIQEVRSDLSTTGRLKGFYADQRRPLYEQVARWLIATARFEEASDVMELLHEDERYEYHRRQRQRGIALNQQLSYTADEEKFAIAIEINKQPPAFKRIREVLENSATSTVTGSAEPHTSPPANTAVIEFLAHDESLTIVLHTADETLPHELRGVMPNLFSDIAELRDKVAARDEDWQTAARQVYLSTIAPFESALEQASVDTIYVRNDSILRYIPFPVLFDGSDVLAARFNFVALAPTIATVKPFPKSVRIAAFANTEPQFPHRALPGAELELKTIVKSSPTSNGIIPGQTYINDKFTPESLFNIHPQVDIVHIASHFEYAAGNNRNSYLAIGNGNRLSVAELANSSLDLSGVALTVLSGCDTALRSAHQNGVEIDGFADAMFLRGAQRLMATLWSISDKTTVDFMQDFYNELARGTQPAEALGRTRRAHAQKHPFDWGGFVLWSPMRVHDLVKNH